ncbi:glycosyltransferase [uncultured Ilyobacter sp.]|uniref:glycosyltransferase family 2 protein n=1 Tax=uncultured Ilyobacter sp. TaxID=544433 RepID=UPI0029C78BA8|nr:glycosyltransferase [uncultured Ilyobacter sp.]
MIVSVLVITYNHEKYIRKCLDSILEQEGDFQLEILVGNDKSPDNTERVLREYEGDKKFIILNRKQNMGATKNLYDLYKKAQGEYIAVLEGDDFWTDPKKIQKQIKVLEEKDDSVLCFTDSHIVDNKDRIIGEKLLPVEKLESIKDVMFTIGKIPTGTILFKNIFLKNRHENKGVEELLTASNIIGDLPLLAFLIKSGKFYRLPEKTGSYRYITISGTSYSAMSIIKKSLEAEKVIRAIKAYYDPHAKFFLNCTICRSRKYLLKDLKKKDKKLLKEYKKSLKFKEILGLNLYTLFSPLDDLIRSLYRKKIKKYRKKNLFINS